MGTPFGWNQLFQALIFLTGNYCFFNLLTIALCLPLFDDAALQKLVPAKWRAHSTSDFRVQGSGFRVQSSRFEVQGSALDPASTTLPPPPSSASPRPSRLD